MILLLARWRHDVNFDAIAIANLRPFHMLKKQVASSDSASSSATSFKGMSCNDLLHGHHVVNVVQTLMHIGVVFPTHGTDNYCSMVRFGSLCDDHMCNVAFPWCFWWFRVNEVQIRRAIGCQIKLPSAQDFWTPLSLITIESNHARMLAKVSSSSIHEPCEHICNRSLFQHFNSGTIVKRRFKRIEPIWPMSYS